MPYLQPQESSPFEEEDKNDEELGDPEVRSDLSEPETGNLLDRVEQYAKKKESEGFIKDMYYGKQIETTE